MIITLQVWLTCQKRLGEVSTNCLIRGLFLCFHFVLQNCFVEYISKCLHLMSKALTSLWCSWFSSIEKRFKEENNFSEAVIFIRTEIFKMS